MKNRINYKKAPKHVALAIDDAKIIKDFLPAPEALLSHENSVKITLSLNKNSIDFFKEKAIENHISYQKMLRRVIDLYVSYHNMKSL